MKKFYPKSYENMVTLTLLRLLAKRKAAAFTVILLCVTSFCVKAEKNNGYLWSDRQISGMVTDGDSELPLPGVNVVVKGTNVGTLTDSNGAYTISVPDEGNVVLVFSFVGFIREEVVVGNQSVIDVSLMPDIKSLSEVVVIGYGTQQKVNITGAVVPIEVDRLENRPVTQTSAALQGLAPGVTVTQNLGTPGNDNANIRIRGIGSISSDNEPLVLVDGIQVNINDVNPDDIEDISVLKDAASASIYGSRAANGVILITTKRGKKGGFTVDIDVSQGIETPTDLPEYVSLREQFLLEDAKATVDGGSPEWNVDFIRNYLEFLDNNPPNDQFQNNDWYEAVLEDRSSISRQRVSVSGGSDRVRGRLSFVNLNQEGLIANTGFERRSVRANLDMDATSWLTLSSDLFFQKAERQEPAKSVREIFWMISELEPYRQLLVGDGLYGWAWRGENPLAYAEAGGDLKDENDYTLLNFNADITPFEGLKINLGYSNLRDNNQVTEFTESFEFYLAGENVGDPPQFSGVNPPLNSLRLATLNTTQNYYKAIINYEKTFGAHGLKVMIGGDALEFETDTVTAFRQNFPLGIRFPQIALGDREGLDNGGAAGKSTLASAFGRINYAFKEKYLIETSFRYDGSSRFAEGNRWGFFPSFSAGWRITEEDFMSGQTVFSDLKLRGSWGKLGNQNIGSFYPYQFLVDVRLPTIINETSQLGGAITQWAFSDISWEESTQTNIGLDFGLFEGKLSGSFDYYVKNTDQVLLLLASVPSSGLEDNFQNGAEIQNKGFEILLNWRDNIGELSYSITGQLDDNRNEVVSLSGTGPFIQNNRIRGEGEPFDALYGWISDGFLSAEDLNDPNVAKQSSNNLVEGSLKFRDLDGNGVIDVNDRTVIGNELPRFNYSLNIGLDWKNFSLNMFLQGVGKRDGFIRHAGQAFGDHLFDFERDFYIAPDHPILNTHGYGELGLEPNTDATMPALGSDNGDFSSFWIQSISYLRVKNITLSYSLPQRLIGKANLSRVRFYLSGDNLFTFTGFYNGFDPEFKSSVSEGRGLWEYPNVGRVTGGINITL